MNNKGMSFMDRIEITLLLLRFIWVSKNVAMVDIMLSEKDNWVHHIIGSDLLMTNKKRVREIVKSFKDVLEAMFVCEI